ncbi:MAG: response regulator transcription factor [Thermoguttaceae bacterium]
MKRSAKKGFPDCFPCDEAWARIAAILTLSPRESEIILLLILGMTEKAAAKRLGIEFSTIHTHVAHVHKRLKVHCVQQLMRRVLEAYADWRKEASPIGCPLESGLNRL